MVKVGKLLITLLAVALLFFGLGFVSNSKDITSTTPIEPYKMVMTKQNGKLIKTYYYKQQ